MMVGCFPRKRLPPITAAEQKREKTMGFFDEMDNAPTGFGRNYLQPGDYVCKVQEIKEIKAEDSHKGNHSFIASLKVVSGTGQCVPGFEGSWVQTIPQKVTAADPKAKERALGTIKQFLASLLGSLDAFDVDGAPKTSEIFSMAVSAAQPFVGTLVRVNVRSKVTKSGGNFSVHTFSPVE